MMQYDNYDTDKTLKQMEDQSLPDLSKMNEHWEQMRESLVPGAQPGAKNGNFLRRPGFYALAAIFIGLIVLVIVMFNKTHPDAEQPVVKAAPVINTPVDTSKAYAEPNTVVIASSTPEKDQTQVVPTIYPFLRISPDAIDSSGLKSNQPIIAPAPSPDYTAQLESFFKEVEKPTQQFVINTKKDTVIYGKDGSAFLIPANTFSMASVTILLKEFYSMKDIVSNRLTTMSYDKQLITGGMVNITAVSGGKEVKMQPGRSIQWFIPDTSAEMKQMQLFNGVQQRAKTGAPQTQNVKINYQEQPGPSVTNSIDTRINNTSIATNPGSKIPTVLDNAAGSVGNVVIRGTTMMDSIATINVDASASDGINWIPQQRFFTPNFFTTRVRVLDLRDTPIRTVNTKKGIRAIFRMSDNSVLNKEELEKRLLEKYKNYYYEIKVVERAGLTKANRTNRGDVVADGVGDSIWIDLREAQRYKLPATDTTRAGTVPVYAGDRERKLKEAFVNSLGELDIRYSVDIRTLGWVNIDKFYRYGLPQIPFKINLNDNASNYYTLLVFDKIRSVMNGATAGNEVLFAGVPEGMTGKVIVVGIKNGKSVLAVKEVTISKTTVTDLVFEEVSADEYKEEVALLDKR